MEGREAGRDEVEEEDDNLLLRRERRLDLDLLPVSLEGGREGGGRTQDMGSVNVHVH